MAEVEKSPRVTLNSGDVDLKKKNLQLAQEHNKNVEPTANSQKEDDLVLENEWCFWEDHYTNTNNSVASTDEYLAALKKNSSFQSIQEFWQVFNKIPNISKLPKNSCFHLFKKGIRPIWEENENGGEFVLKVKKFQTDEIWNELVLSVIGEQFASYLSDIDDICGISIRKKQGMDFNMIHIWNKNIVGRDNIPRALKCLFPFLLDECIYFYYKEHKKSNSGNRLQQLRNQNKSTSALRPSSNAFIPQSFLNNPTTPSGKTVRFNLPKSKSESHVATSPDISRRELEEKELLDNEDILDDAKELPESYSKKKIDKEEKRIREPLLAHQQIHNPKNQDKFIETKLDGIPLTDTDIERSIEKEIEKEIKESVESKIESKILEKDVKKQMQKEKKAMANSEADDLGDYTQLDEAEPKEEDNQIESEEMEEIPLDNEKIEKDIQDAIKSENSNFEKELDHSPPIGSPSPLVKELEKEPNPKKDTQQDNNQILMSSSPNPKSDIIIDSPIISDVPIMKEPIVDEQEEKPTLEEYPNEVEQEIENEVEEEIKKEVQDSLIDQLKKEIKEDEKAFLDMEKIKKNQKLERFENQIAQELKNSDQENEIAQVKDLMDELAKEEKEIKKELKREQQESL
ncbi:hypothetical protein CYY_001935 [Polysphondylium violaceum]|uniref:Eukaryotic translation initiation factor 4E family protein n=1 Tax=Polysphondylium violaceum TaxID=133409 RepID=A0A8J4PZ91_9MYCE|nr:hypothetical protein CYY_001935 [Polysphondylium violaceum]